MLGNFTIILGSKTFEMTPRAYLVECDDIEREKPGFCTRKNYCLFGIDNFSAKDTENRIFNDNVFLLGDLFLKNFYTVYHADETDESYVKLAVSK